MTAAITHFGVAIPDLHCNDHHPYACEAIMLWGSERRCDSWAQLGDAVSFDAGSVHPPSKEPEPYFDEIATQRQLFRSFHDAFGRKNEGVKMYYTPGNHERRWFRDVFNHPRFTGVLPDLYTINGADDCGALIAEPYAFGKTSSIIRLEQTGNPSVPGPVTPVVRELGARTKRYGLNLTHGQWHNRNATRTHAERMPFGVTIHGHTHTMQAAIADSWTEPKSRAYSAGWLGFGREHYQNRSDAWQLGFATYFWCGEDWHVRQFPIFWDGKRAWFEADGHLYEARKKLLNTPKGKGRKR